MQILSYTEVSALLKPLGRTWSDGEVLHFNWSCSGFELRFHGSCLSADFSAACSKEYEGIPGDETAPFHYSWPCAAVYLDGAEEPAYRFRLDGEKRQTLLFRSDRAETHTIRVVKLTENVKTFLALEALHAEGELLPLPETEPVRAIEFIGDSITCGYGNEAAQPLFYYDTEENGRRSHASLAAELLGLECSMVCVSGICLAPREEIPIGIAMNEIFLYTDLPGQKRCGLPPEKWSFESHPRAYAVLNLGTNDSTAMSFSKRPAELEAQYREEYGAFLKTLRGAYGPDTHIICAMGSMDYYLFDVIREAVAEYSSETGDRRVSTFKYMRMCPLESAGAAGHPSATTQKRMAEDLAAYIRRLEAARNNT